MGLVNKLFNISGVNPDIGMAAEIVWDAGGAYVYPTVARIHDIASANVTDTLAGTGAQKMSVEGLDANYNVVTEIVDLNGTTNVPTVNSYLRINSLRVTQAGSGGSNVGAITATAQIDATVSAQINIGNNQALSTVFTVPRGASARIFSWWGSAFLDAAAVCNLELLVRPLGGAFFVFAPRSIAGRGGTFFRPFFMPTFVPGQADMQVRAISSDALTQVSSGFDLLTKQQLVTS